MFWLKRNGVTLLRSPNLNFINEFGGRFYEPFTIYLNGIEYSDNTDNWILYTGKWSDTGVWIDTSVWVD